MHYSQKANWQSLAMAGGSPTTMAHIARHWIVRSCAWWRVSIARINELFTPIVHSCIPLIHVTHIYLNIFIPELFKVRVGGDKDRLKKLIPHTNKKCSNSRRAFKWRQECNARPRTLNRPQVSNLSIDELCYYHKMLKKNWRNWFVTDKSNEILTEAQDNEKNEDSTLELK